MAKPKVKTSTKRIEWKIPDDMVRRYASNIVIQAGEHEFLLHFFDVYPPVFTGTPEEIDAQFEKIETVPARCVASIVVAREKMPGFLEAINKVVSASHQDDQSTAQ